MNNGSDLIQLREKPVVARHRFDDLHAGVVAKVLGDLELLAQRVEPVGIDAGHGDRRAYAR